MKADELIMVSVDDHLVEPPDMFTGRLPGAMQEFAPRVERLPNGSDVWVFNGSQIPNIGLNAVAGRPKEEYGIEPTAFDEMRPGCFDVHERIKDMNAGGVLGSMNFPSFPGFSARLFAACQDKSVAMAVLRAYNDWHIDEWCGAYPGRFIPMALPVLWDAELCAEEVRRVAAKGCHSMTFTENPAALGFPSFHDASWDPLWTALSDEDVVLSIHLGSSGSITVTSPDAPVDVMITLQPMNICSAASDLLWSRVLKNFPAIRIALSEGGTGWIPYFLDRVDRTYDMHRLWTGQDFGDKLPSDVFREHFLTCFISDPVGIQLRHQIGLDNIAWESDYPHSDSSWPNAPEELAAVLAGVPDDEVEQITWRNACRWYSFDPLAHRPRGDCTVAALRAEAAGHDVSIHSYDKGRFTRSGKGVDLGELAAKATA
jgi:predicted TIM-barrel fold metal-dependent hydrolase